MTKASEKRPFTLRLLALVAALAALVALSAQGQEAPTGDSALLEYEENTVGIIETYGGSVVAIDVTSAGRTVSPDEIYPRDMLPDFFREFLPPGFFQNIVPPDQPRTRQTAGSGFVIDTEGRMITNWHVVESALLPGEVELSEGSSITVTFPGGTPLPVRVVGGSSLYDLALLEPLAPEDLPEGLVPIEFADTDALRPGQKAIAIGNPFGFESTVTVGIISAVGRHFPYIGEVDFPLVQTDAAINPGSSGGPLLDSSGRLIGVNTAIIPTVSATGERGNLGIGFAVPADIVQSALPELMGGGVASIPTRPRLGVEIVEVGNYPAEVRTRLNLPDSGVGILAVEPDSPADEAGLRGSQFSITLAGGSEPIRVPGDIILETDGEPVGNISELQSFIVSQQDGTEVVFTVLRDGEELEVPVTLRVSPGSED